MHRWCLILLCKIAKREYFKGVHDLCSDALLLQTVADLNHASRTAGNDDIRAALAN